MRLFIAVNFNDEIKNRLLEIQDRLRAQCLRGNFTRSENFHLTLAFLGETSEERLNVLFRILEEINKPPYEATPPFEISFNRTGCFTHSRKELWWIGAERNSAGHSLLEAIHARLLDRLSEEGFSVDKRPFNAHITLGREIKHSQAITLDCPEIKISVDRISLMKSEHIRGVLTYTEIFGTSLR
jgi:2'-5' RNA ligase